MMMIIIMRMMREGLSRTLVVRRSISLSLSFSLNLYRYGTFKDTYTHTQDLGPSLYYGQPAPPRSRVCMYVCEVVYSAWVAVAANPFSSFLLYLLPQASFTFSLAF